MKLFVHEIAFLFVHFLVYFLVNLSKEEHEIVSESENTQLRRQIYKY